MQSSTRNTDFMMAADVVPTILEHVNGAGGNMVIVMLGEGKK